VSRNLCRVDCAECPGGHEHIVLEGPVRQVTAAEDPGYHAAHAGLLIAEARCTLCYTLYFAWVDWPGGNSFWHLSTKCEQRFCDLSYRHSFNDEPAPQDLPRFRVRVEYVCEPIADERGTP
jgi:hypothetical protein